MSRPKPTEPKLVDEYESSPATGVLAVVALVVVFVLVGWRLFLALTGEVGWLW